MKTNRILLIVGVAVAAAWLPQAAFAQDGYMFRKPQVTFSMRLGTAQPAAQGDIFNFLTTELELDREDFAAFTWGGDINFRVDPKADIVLSVTVAQSSKRAAFERWEDSETGELIYNETDLRRIPVTLGMKFFPLSRGREIGRYAYIPTRFSPYVGVAGGVMFYSLEQEGDFVDDSTDPPVIFTDWLESDGAAPTVQALAGADLWILPRVGINVEGRYGWASANLNDAFSDFDKIDLRGFQLTTGLSVRF